jgi:hypothetical protein
MIWYGREYSPARGWDLENDTITKTVGRKTILNKYYKNHYLEIKLVKFIYLSTAIANESEVLKTIIVLIRNNFETMIVNFYHT